MTNQVSESAPAGTEVLRVRIHPQTTYSLADTQGGRLTIDSRTGVVDILSSPGTADQTLTAEIIASVDGVEQSRRAFTITNLKYVAAGAGAPVISGVPTVTGNAQDGQTIVLIPAAVAGTSTRTWQLLRDDVVTGSPFEGDAYVCVTADVAAVLKFRQIETNDTGSDTADSAGTSAVAAAVPPDTAPVIEGVPTVSGTTTVGSTLTLTAAPVSGNPTPDRTWQLIRDDVDIGSPFTASTYVLQVADAGAVLEFRQIETNSEDTDTATSAGTATIADFIDLAWYDEADEGVSAGANLVDDSEPEAGEFWALTGATVTTTGLGGFFDRAALMADNSTLRLAYIRLPSGPDATTEYIYKFAIKVASGDVPSITSSISSGDCSIVLDDTPMAADSVTAIGSGWYVAEVTYTYDADPAPNIGVIKYTGQSSKQVLVTAYDVRLVPGVAPTGFVVPRGSITPLTEGEQTYKSNYDALVTASASSLAFDLDSAYSQYTPYQSQYPLMAAIGMMIATNDETYADQFLDWAERVIAKATLIDTAGRKNWGPRVDGSGADGFMAGGAKSSYFLDELQGAAAMALGGYIISQQSGYTGSLITRADAVVAFVKAEVLDKWHARGAYISTAVNYLNPAGGAGGWDQAAHIGVIARALDAHTPTTQYATWANTVSGHTSARFVDSVANGGRTPVSGSQYVNTSGVIPDTSHTCRLPFSVLMHWLLNGGSISKTQVTALGKHFGSMIWNQDGTTPLFSNDQSGGTPYGGATSAIYHGWHVTAAASTEAQTALDAAAVKTIGSGVSGNTYYSGKMNLLAWQMACRAIRASL